MKRLTIALVLAGLLVGCGQPQTLTIDGKIKEYPTYGLFNSDEKKSDKVCYELSIGNTIWGVLLFETIIAPVYFFGFSLFNPVSPKGPKGCGIDS